MRIVTRPDFDGIVCAALLAEALGIQRPIKWVEPNDMQNNRVNVYPTDIIANLAFHPECLMWFDHHESNLIEQPFNGAFAIAPSAAGLIFDFFKKFKPNCNTPAITVAYQPFKRDYTSLVVATDQIDSAQLPPDAVLHPGRHPYVLLSSTISSRNLKDRPYWNKLVAMLRRQDIDEILKDPEVKKRSTAAVAQNERYGRLLREYTKLEDQVSITDFRTMPTMPSGNRFLVFSLFPQTYVNVKVRYLDETKEKVIVSIGHSIFKRKCNVNSGLLCSQYGGGGHKGAGSCSFPAGETDVHLRRIIDILLKNEVPA
ncbi:MAG: exopolyphosphatase [bacterium]|nr:exopolyphosphatase [bacterium]